MFTYQMNIFKRLVLIIFLVIIAACDNSSVQHDEQAIAIKTDKPSDLTTATDKDIALIADNLQIKYHVINNQASKHCDINIEHGACFQAELILTANTAINVKDWQIHFSHISPIQKVDSQAFSIEHINGDLHQINLSKQFQGFAKGETKRIVFWATFWSLSETDPFPNYIVSVTNGQNRSAQPRVIKSTQATTDAETGLETLPFVVPFTDKEKHFKRTKNDHTQWLNSESLYQKNSKMTDQLLDVSANIIPTPQQLTVDKLAKKINLALGINVHYHQVPHSAVAAALARLNRLGVSEKASGIDLHLRLSSDKTRAKNSYSLTVSANSIDIVGADSTGVFYGLQSLAALLMPNSLLLPSVTIKDQPYYPFRGLLVDVARNFHSKVFILRLLEQMSAYKLNTLHLHLADDEAWRLEIPSLPELTTLGANRCLDSKEQACLQPQLGAGIDLKKSVNGFFTVADYQEILKAASARHIQVIPSLDMPGHSRAAIKAMALREKRLLQTENPEQATRFRLSDPHDQSQYSSIQFYQDNTINVCLSSAYAFVNEVMSQVKAIHAQVNHPLTRYHIGADETAGAWKDSPACQKFLANNQHGITKVEQLGAYFIERVADILLALDIEVAGWSDGLSHTRVNKMPDLVQANAWDVLFWQGHNNVHKLANQQWQIVISSPDVLYFDFPYRAHPKEHGYYWAAREVNTEKVFQFMPDNLPIHAEFWRDRENNPYQADDSKNRLNKGVSFYGIQGQLWSENTRTDNMAEYKIYPRLFALAERAWHKATWSVPYNHQGGIYHQNTDNFNAEKQQQRDQQWQIFANIIGQKALVKLEQQGVFYRLPLVGAKVENGLLLANTAFTNVSIEYQIDNAPWQDYRAGVKVNDGDVIKVRTKSFDGKRRSMILTLKHHLNKK